MSRQPKIMRWWPLLGCLVLAGVLLAIEVELPVDPAFHMAVQIAIVVLVYGLVAWWCYVDDRERAKRVAKAHRSPAHPSDHAQPPAPTAASVAMPASAGSTAVGDVRGSKLKVGEVKLRPVPMAPKPGSGSSSASERNDWNGF